MDRRCETCEWFDPDNPTKKEGSCRRVPPVMNGLLANSFTGFDPNRGVWPAVSVLEWCGAWEKKGD